MNRVLVAKTTFRAFRSTLFAMLIFALDRKNTASNVGSANPGMPMKTFEGILFDFNLYCADVVYNSVKLLYTRIFVLYPVDHEYLCPACVYGKMF
jgi:hypothetical protein